MNLRERFPKAWSACSYLFEYLSNLLFLTVLIPCIRKRRIKKWQDHVERYVSIASPTSIGATRIRFVAGHLDILDRKFGFLLAFHALIATVATLYINVTLPRPVHGFPTPLHRFAYVWAMTTFLCLLGFSRAKWGDLGGPEKGAEDRHVVSLIKSVVTRSAGLRLCVFLTVAEIVLLVWAVRSEGPHDFVQPEPKRIAVIGPFSTRVACSTDPRLEAKIEETASIIQRTNVSKVRIVGEGDAMPVA